VLPKLQQKMPPASRDNPIFAKGRSPGEEKFQGKDEEHPRLKIRKKGDFHSQRKKPGIRNTYIRLGEPYFNGTVFLPYKKKSPS